MNITLRQLQVFLAVSQAQSLTDAAARLFLSKGAVSMALAELERQIGRPVFDRINNRLVINQEGLRLLPLADELLSRSRSIDSLFDEDAAKSDILRIGASDTIGSELLPDLLATFRQQSGYTQQKLVITNTADACQKLLDFEIDLALVEGEVSHSSLLVEAFAKDEVCVICAPQSPLCDVPNLRYEMLNGSSWILREEGSGTREYFLQKLAPEIAGWQEIFQMNTTAGLINSVALDMGLGCVSRRSAAAALREKRVVALPLPAVMMREFRYVLHRKKYVSPSMAAFINQCKGWRA